MSKIVLVGAGGVIFAQNFMKDILLDEELRHHQLTLMDIDAGRLAHAATIGGLIAKKLGVEFHPETTTDLRQAVRGADYVITIFRCGTIHHQELEYSIPMKYGVDQVVSDTLGPGGVFRGLRTLRDLFEVLDVMEEECPGAYLLNYVNPMSMNTIALSRRAKTVKVIGLCHSVQVCVPTLLESVGMEEYAGKCRWKIGGINHQAWLTQIEDEKGNDLYPEIKRRSLSGEYAEKMKNDLVRHEIMHRFGYYNTESSEHTAEYSPYFIKSGYPELIERFNIPLDEYPRRCVNQIAGWKALREKVTSAAVEHTISKEFGMRIIRAMVNGEPYLLHGNVLNGGLIPNLPQNACVEVPCLIDGNGLTPCRFGELPEQCAALNRTNINVQNMTIEAARTRRKELVYMAAYLDPHTAAELSLDDIKSLCDDLFAAHKGWLPEYR